MHTLKIDNFGKIERGEVCVGDFTVFAGPNNTGKSFVSKLLYSVFNALNADLTHERLARLALSFRREVKQLRHGPPAIDQELRLLADKVTKIASSYSRNDEPLDHIIAQLADALDEAKRWSERAERRIGADTTDDHPRGRTLSSILQELRVSVDRLKTWIDDFEDPSVFALTELRYRTEQNLIQNFQVSEIEMLKGVRGETMQVDLDDALHITVSDSGVELVPGADALEAIGLASNLIYLESPVYWKLFRALQFVGPPRSASRDSSRHTLTGVPGYFYDLADSLTFEYSGEVAYPGVCNILTGCDAINGRISISDRGEMAFEEAGRSYPLHTASAGVANIGILAALIDRKVIDRGTMLFIDEPEAHLHPGWQVVMAEALFELAKGGVQVVIATHSTDILKWLEVRMKKNPSDARFIALNHFPNPAQSDDPLEIRIEQVKQDLTKPFLDLFLELP